MPRGSCELLWSESTMGASELGCFSHGQTEEGHREVGLASAVACVLMQGLLSSRNSKAYRLGWQLPLSWLWSLLDGGKNLYVQTDACLTQWPALGQPSALST